MFLYFDYDIVSDYLHFSPRTLFGSIVDSNLVVGGIFLVGSFFAGTGTHDQLRVDKRKSLKVSSDRASFPHLEYETSKLRWNWSVKPIYFVVKISKSGPFDKYKNICIGRF